MRHTCGLSCPCHQCKIPPEPEEKRKDGSQAMAWTHHWRLQICHLIRCTMIGARLWPEHTIEGFKHATQYDTQQWEPGYGLDTPSKASNMPPDTTHNDESQAMAWTHHQWWSWNKGEKGVGSTLGSKSTTHLKWRNMLTLCRAAVPAWRQGAR